MIGVDTNILVRYIVRDDPKQFSLAEAFLEKRTADDPAFVSLIVLSEFIWVLRRVYRFPPGRVHEALMVMAEVAGINFEDELFVLRIIEAGAALRDEVADRIIAHCAGKAGCPSVVTFDKNAARAISAMHLLS